MMMEGMMKFATGQALTGTSDVVSTNVYDAGAAKLVFGGSASRVKIAVGFSAAASTGSDYTLRARFVGADNAALTTNPEILADTGASAAGVAVPFLSELVPSQQKVAKRFYGMMFTQAGTTPTSTVTASVVETAQSNLLK